MAWAPDYATDTELKAYLHITDTDDDAEITLAIAAASRAIDRHTNRQFGLVGSPEARYYTAGYDRKLCRWYVDIDDLMTETGLEIVADIDDDGTYDDAITEFALRPANAAVESRPWTRIYVRPGNAVRPNGNDGGVKVTARWGWTTVPDTVKQATLLQASRFFKRRDAPFGVAGSPELGSELRLLAKVDPDVAVALGPYVRWWAAA